MPHIVFSSTAASPPPPPPPPPAPPPLSSLQGINISGMEWAQPGIRTSPASRINIHFGIPRQADLTFLASQGFGVHRLPIEWELFQPVLASSNANAAVLSAYGITAAGQMSPQFMTYLLDALDYAAAAGVKIFIDLHNDCQYRDYTYQADGSVTGFTTSTVGELPFTSLGFSGCTPKIMALVAGSATIPQSDFNAFWVNLINYVEAGTLRKVPGHAGLAGYGLMNEPNSMPSAGSNVAGGFPEDLTIWNTFAQGAVNAIRAVDATTPIYVSGNDFEIPWTGNPGGSYLGNNPSYPLTGTNLIYESHFYLDSHTSGARFDWGVESTQPFSLGESNTHGVTTLTGQIRAQYAVDFKNNTGKPMTVSELGMPSGDINWQTSMENATALLFTNGIGHSLWVGGAFWAVQDHSLCGAPNFKQGKTFIPQAYGVMHKAAARTLFDIYSDADTHWGPAGTVCTVTLYTRGYSPNPLVVTLTKAGSGTLSAATATIPAGANQKVTFTYTTAGTEDATVTYTGQTVLPSVSHFYSMDPVTFSATDAVVAGRAALAKFGAIEWLAANAYTDYMGGVPAGSGVVCRAIWNSGFGENYYNAHGMKAWWDTRDGNTLPVVGIDSNSKKFLSVNSGIGLWSRKTIPNLNGPGTEPNPVNSIPYGADDPHFHIAAISLSAANVGGAIFAVNDDEGQAKSVLGLSGGAANYQVGGSDGSFAQISAPTQLGLSSLHVLSSRFAVGSQQLRVDQAQVAAMAASPPAAPFGSMAIAFLFDNFFPAQGFSGSFYGAISGKGTPSNGEMAVMENYLKLLSTTSGTGGAGSPAPPPPPPPPAGDFPSSVAALTAWFDPSTLSTMKLSATSGGTVLAAGSVVGEIDTRTTSGIKATIPDAERPTLRQDTSSHFYLDGMPRDASAGGAATTAFYIAAALKITGGTEPSIREVWADNFGGNVGYQLFYAPDADVMVFRTGNGSTFTQVLDTTILNGVSGVNFFVHAWDDGVNINIQVNNGSVNSVARAIVSPGVAAPFIYWADDFGDAQFVGNCYGLMWAKDSALTAPDRTGIKTWLGAKAGLAL